MKIIETKVYTFNELSDNAKKVALDQNRYNLVDDEWWRDTYDEAKNIGIKITGFDLFGRNDIQGEFIQDSEYIAKYIMNEHGQTCATYIVCENFLNEKDAIVNEAERDEYGEFVDVETLDEKLDECENAFKDDILHEYHKILTAEHDYLVSDECISDYLEANEYQFTENGKRFLN